MLVRPRDLADRCLSRSSRRNTRYQLKPPAILGQFPQAGYAAVVENWRQLPDGQIEFTTRHLPTAD
jgi:hypothetical protein